MVTTYVATNLCPDALLHYAFCIFVSFLESCLISFGTEAREELFLVRHKVFQIPRLQFIHLLAVQSLGCRNKHIVKEQSDMSRNWCPARLYDCTGFGLSVYRYGNSFCIVVTTQTAVVRFGLCIVGPVWQIHTSQLLALHCVNLKLWRSKPQTFYPLAVCLYSFFGLHLEWQHRLRLYHLLGRFVGDNQFCSAERTFIRNYVCIEGNHSTARTTSNGGNLLQLVAVASLATSLQLGKIFFKVKFLDYLIAYFNFVFCTAIRTFHRCGSRFKHQGCTTILALKFLFLRDFRLLELIVNILRLVKFCHNFIYLALF